MFQTFNWLNMTPVEKKSKQCILYYREFDVNVTAQQKGKKNSITVFYLIKIDIEYQCHPLLKHFHENIVITQEANGICQQRSIVFGLERNATYSHIQIR